MATNRGLPIDVYYTKGTSTDYEKSSSTELKNSDTGSTSDQTSPHPFSKSYTIYYQRPNLDELITAELRSTLTSEEEVKIYSCGPTSMDNQLRKTVAGLIDWQGGRLIEYVSRTMSGE